MDNGGNVFISAGKTVGDEIRQTAAEIGVELDEAGTQVIDHGRVNAIEDSGDHTAFTVEPNQFIPAEIITGKISEAMTFEGIGMKLDAANKLVFPIAWAAPTAYSWYPNEPISEYPMALGTLLYFRKPSLLSIQAKTSSLLQVCKRETTPE